MNILVISNIEWADGNAFGNTTSNFFSGFDANFSCIYRRTSMPSNQICNNYYTITSKDCLKNILKKENIGKQFYYEYSKPKENTHKTSGSTEKKLINFLHKFNLSFIRDLDDSLFALKGWDNKKFKNFVEKADPDVVFLYIKASKPATLLLDAVKKYVPKCKVIASIVDDVYGVSNKAKRKEITKQIEMTDKLYGASVELCEKYSKIFNREFTPLYKGCTFETPVLEKHNDKIQLVYAGNLYYGRAETLAQLSSAIAKHNAKSDKKVELSIYTATDVVDSMKAQLNVEGASKLCEPKPYGEIKQILSNSDIVLHVESFDPKQIEVVKYSFSTKLIDCMQSGSVMMAIGPDSTSSIKYAMRVPGSITVADLSTLEATVDKLAKDNLFEMAQKTREFAVKNHSADNLRERLIKDFTKTVYEDEHFE